MTVVAVTVPSDDVEPVIMAASPLPRVAASPRRSALSVDVVVPAFNAVDDVTVTPNRVAGFRSMPSGWLPADRDRTAGPGQHAVARDHQGSGWRPVVPRCVVTSGSERGGLGMYLVPASSEDPVVAGRDDARSVVGDRASSGRPCGARTRRRLARAGYQPWHPYWSGAVDWMRSATMIC